MDKTQRGQAKVEAFGSLMLRELENNSHKGDWRNAPVYGLAIGAMRDLCKLLDALDREDREKAIEQAADTANQCMFIADVLGALE